MEQIKNTQIPNANKAKYLGRRLAAELRRKTYINKKREELEIRYKKTY